MHGVRRNGQAMDGLDWASADTFSNVLGTFTGTAGNDVIRGTSGMDTIDVSQGGNDSVKALGDFDRIFMGATLTAADKINGGDGYDVLLLDGDYSAGLVFGSDTVRNIEMIELAYGHSYVLTLSDATVAAGGYIAVGFFSDSTDFLHFNGSAEVDGDLQIEGGQGNDILIGGGGNDTFRLGYGADIVDGGSGHNLINFDDALDFVTVDLHLQGTAQETNNGLLTLNNVENMSGTFMADTLVGDEAANIIYTEGGSDHVSAGGGQDIVFIFGSTDGDAPASLNGGRGEDLLAVDPGTNTPAFTLDLSLRSAQDTGSGTVVVKGFENAQGWTVNDFLTGDKEANVLYGAGGDDKLVGGADDDSLHGDSYIWVLDPNNFVTSPTVLESVQPGGDHLDGGSGDDRLYGGAGDDILVGGLGRDVLFGETGADIFQFVSLASSTVKAPDRIMDFEHGNLIDLHTIDANTAKSGNQAFHLGGTPDHAGDIVISYDADKNLTMLSLFAASDAIADAHIILMGDHSDLTLQDFVL